MFVDQGIDEIGLDEIQRKYLTTLYECGNPVSKEALANMLGEISLDQLSRVIEPYLWKMGFIESTSRGRNLTDKGFKHLAVTGALTDDAI